MTAPCRAATRRRPLPLIVALAAVVAAAGCSSGSVSTTTSTTPVPRTLAPPDTAAPTTGPGTTAGVVPSSPASSAEDAAAALVSAWSSGNRARAAQIATAGAVATLFALPYPQDNLQSRGCSNGTPATCTYRNTASSTGEIYDLVVAQSPRGWYVTAVQHET